MLNSCLPVFLNLKINCNDYFNNILKMQQYLALLLFLCLLYVIYVYILQSRKKFYWYQNTLTHQGYKVLTYGWHPIGGKILLQTKKGFQKTGDALSFFKQTGQFDIILSNILENPILLVNNIELIKELFAPNSYYNYHKDPKTYSIFKTGLGEGIVFNEDDHWKKSRKIITSVLNYNFIMDLIPNIYREANLVYDSIQKDESYPTIYLLEYMNDLFGNIVAKSFFGEEILNKTINGEKITIFAAKLLTEMGEAKRTVDVFILGGMALTLGFRKRFREIKQKIKLLRKVVIGFIKQKYQQIRLQQGTNRSKNERNIIAKIYYAKKENPQEFKQFDEEQIANQFNSLFFAGLQTTTHLTLMMIYQLGRNPEVKQKLVTQIQQILKTPQDFNNPAKLKEMVYFDRVQKQTLRMHGPAPGMMLRKATKDTYLKDIKICKGTLVSGQYVACHYNEKIFKQPKKFDPGRWLDKQQINKYTELYFGGGPRTCVGKLLALIENKVVLSIFLKRFDYKIEKQDFKMKMSFVYYPQRISTTLTKKQ